MSNEWIYPVALRKEEGQFHAYSSDLPEAIASGETQADALREMGLALATAVRWRVKHELDLSPPGPAAKDETERVTLPAMLAAKASVYCAFRESHMTKVALAEAIGCTEKDARRLLDPDHATKLDRFEAAMLAMDKHLVIGFAA